MSKEVSQVEFKAMGCQMLAAVDSSSPEALGLLGQAPAWFEEWEQCLSRFRPDSELSLMNSLSGSPVKVSQTMWQVIQAALWAERESQGIVTPRLLGALEDVGYDRTFDEVVQTDISNRPAPPPATVNQQAFRLNSNEQSVEVPAGVRLDLGGIAKGWAADRAARRLAAHAPALVDAGGDISVTAPPFGELGWPIGISDPDDPDNDVAILRIRRGGVATSGRDYRRWMFNGRWQHHILDPRTGLPADTDVLSATVIGPSAEQAELGAKVAFVLGSREGMLWLERHPRLAGLLILQDGSTVKSRRLTKYLWR